MKIALNDSRLDPQPFLLRFRRPLDRPAGAIAYDRVTRVNMMVGQSIPAVKAGCEMKTLSGRAED